MIVNHIQQNHHPQAMGRVYKGFEVVRRSIIPLRRKLQNAVVAPAAISLKTRERHHLNDGDAEFSQSFQLLFGCPESPFFRECADVNLVDHSLVPRPAGPVLMLPRKVVIDDG